MQGDDSPTESDRRSSRGRTATEPRMAARRVDAGRGTRDGGDRRGGCALGGRSEGREARRRSPRPFAVVRLQRRPQPLRVPTSTSLICGMGRRPISHPSLRAIRNANHFRMSPDRSMVAFDDGNTLYVATIDGSHIRQFTPDGGVSAPSWSPDGARIVFSEGGGIFLVDVSTGELTPVLRDGDEIWFPNFSADGRTILYTTVRRRRNDPSDRRRRRGDAAPS